MAEVCGQSGHHSTSENSRGAGQMDPKLGDERLKARPQATASVKADCTSRHSRINGPSEAVAWKRYFCFITKTEMRECSPIFEHHSNLSSHQEIKPLKIC